MAEFEVGLGWMGYEPTGVVEIEVLGLRPSWVWLWRLRWWVVVGSGCLIGGGGGWIFLCLGRKKISRYGFGWKENLWACI